MLALSAMIVVIVPEETITPGRWEHLTAKRHLSRGYGEVSESATVT